MAYTQDDFQEWIFWITFKMDYFTGDFAKENNLNLDYSAKSLDDLEKWILNNFDDPKELRRKDDGNLIDYLLIYIGETFREHIGGKWFIDLEDMKNKYYSMPVLKIEKTTGDIYISPMTYAAACIHMKKGNYINSILRDYMEDKGNASQKVDPTKTADEIEKAVYAKLKPQGFRKFGRTLHRFVLEDISQVINFQIGSPTGSMKGHMCVNVGIRIPECDEKTSHPETNKMYYYEYECNLRRRLVGEVGLGANVEWFDLTKDTQKITANIIKQIEDKVMPTFDAFSSREAILEPEKENMFFNISPFVAACIQKRRNQISTTLRDKTEDKGNISKKVDVKKVAEEIEDAVYAKFEPQGFQKFGITLHRFVSGDISQVINFQIFKRTRHMRVNIGIRIPECAEVTFHPKMNRKYYNEYACTFRKPLDGDAGSGSSWFDLTKDIQKITADIIKQIEDKVIPAFDVMCNREAFLEPGKEFPFYNISPFNNCTLKEALIYGHLGNMEKAKEIFEVYYQREVDDYNDKMTNGTKYYLKKGQRIISMGQDITAEEDGYVTIYEEASHWYIDNLDKLAVKLKLR